MTAAADGRVQEEGRHGKKGGDPHRCQHRSTKVNADVEFRLQRECVFSCNAEDGGKDGSAANEDAGKEGKGDDGDAPTSRSEDEGRYEHEDEAEDDADEEEGEHDLLAKSEEV